MTTRKTDIALSPRLTAYVTREEGAAELRVVAVYLGRDGRMWPTPQGNSPRSHGDNSALAMGRR